MLNIEAIVKAAETASNRAHHGPTCNGWLGYSVNKNGDKISHDDIPKEEQYLWWQAFDEKQCTCGIGVLRKFLWDRHLSETYCKKEIKRIEGFSATQHHTSNVDSLKAEMDTLRQQIVETKNECERLNIENSKLIRKLNAIKNAATDLK